VVAAAALESVDVAVLASVLESTAVLEFDSPKGMFRGSNGPNGSVRGSVKGSLKGSVKHQCQCSDILEKEVDRLGGFPNGGFAGLGSSGLNGSTGSGTLGGRPPKPSFLLPNSVRLLPSNGMGMRTVCEGSAAAEEGADEG
jgi:hypothetical protein